MLKRQQPMICLFSYERKMPKNFKYYFYLIKTRKVLELRKMSASSNQKLEKHEGEPCEDWFSCDDYDELGAVACFLCVSEGCEHEEDEEDDC
jgi:hypothetical protein